MKQCEARRKFTQPAEPESRRLMRLEDASSTWGRALANIEMLSVSQKLSAAWPACARAFACFLCYHVPSPMGEKSVVDEIMTVAVVLAHTCGNLQPL